MPAAVLAAGRQQPEYGDAERERDSGSRASHTSDRSGRLVAYLRPQRSEREHDEADAGKQERDPGDEAEQRQVRRHVAHVQGSRERGLRNPDVARAVRRRLARLRSVTAHSVLLVPPPGDNSDFGVSGFAWYCPICE